MRLKTSIGVLAAVMVLTLSACGQKKEGMGEGMGMDKSEMGCCQHGENACASDVTKSQCDQMAGKFHKDHMCSTDAGKCTRKER
ncbi:hypothetical protein [Microbulbifer sp. 2205BS26-8]|uniref:hypothetical protein n=1 Tax=Microbulbifer sp. 2205BS26-8 TaxID=3064386 RepID=UPI00273EAD83|nr:hypothetical protein [Microbulbifer sp. 2205BS26-8]MDP5208203.1 hypothetical protein [Microbulbifer sp. 2205BS26-8]